MSPRVEDVVGALLRRYADIGLSQVAAWKKAASNRRAIGCLPVFAPREVLWAAGALPVFVRGAGDAIETIRGDAYYQSYICHLPRSVIELGLGGWLDALDGMVFPNTCDVIRNLSGIWQDLFPQKLSRFLDPPQAAGPDVSVDWWRGELGELYETVCELSGRRASDDAIETAILEYDEVRLALRALARARRETPWLVPADEAYLVRRAGDALPPLEHAEVVEEYLAAAQGRRARAEDRVRVVISGAFCEQPPVALLRAVEKAGCYVVEDDLLLGLDDLRSGGVPGNGGQLERLARAYVHQGARAAVRFDRDRTAAADLVARVRAAGASGVIFAAPSFCDPALLEQPRLTAALDAAGVAYTAFKYAENTGQFQGIREQAGTFADTVKLWGDA